MNEIGGGIRRTAGVAAVRAALGRARRRLVAGLARARFRSGIDGVALTFDDGPHPEHTPAILDVLSATGVPATFFVEGRKAESFPHLVRRMRDEGHAVGTHSMTHPNMRQVRAWTAISDSRQGRKTVEQILGQHVPMFRPPMGRLTILLSFAVRGRGWATWLWSDDSYDWKSDATPASILDACGGVSRGSIIVLHDDLPVTVDATRVLIDHFASTGTPLVALPANRTTRP